MQENEKLILCDYGKFDRLFKTVETLCNGMCRVNNWIENIGSHKMCYTNKETMELLGVTQKTLKKYRDQGLLGYSKESDKYWYTREDISNFLAQHHLEPFACI